MSVVFRYIPSGEEIMAQFTQGPKQKVYMYWKGKVTIGSWGTARDKRVIG